MSRDVQEGEEPDIQILNQGWTSADDASTFLFSLSFFSTEKKRLLQRKTGPSLTLEKHLNIS